MSTLTTLGDTQAQKGDCQPGQRVPEAGGEAVCGRRHSFFLSLSFLSFFPFFLGLQAEDSHYSCGGSR